MDGLSSREDTDGARLARMVLAEGEDCGLGVGHLAAAVGVSTQTVYNWKKGKFYPRDYDVVRRLSTIALMLRKVDSNARASLRVSDLERQKLARKLAAT